MVVEQLKYYIKHNNYRNSVIFICNVIFVDTIYENELGD